MKLIGEYKSVSQADTEALARELAGIFKPNDVVLLQGDLGSGKTFLVKALCELWHTRQPAASPSFALIYQYGGPLPVNHVDLYRIGSALELANLGLGELLESGAVTFIEWPQLVEGYLDKYYKIEISMQPEGRLFRLFKKE